MLCSDESCKAFTNSCTDSEMHLTMKGQYDSLATSTDCTCCFRVVQNIADHRPKSHYLLAVDASMHTLQELIQVRDLIIFFPQYLLGRKSYIVLGDLEHSSVILSCLFVVLIFF